MAKILLFAIVGGVAGLAGGAAGEGVLAGWPSIAAVLPHGDAIRDFARVAAWTACLGVLLAVGLVVGQNLYLRRRLIGLGQFFAVAGGGLAAGLAAGVAGQAMQRVLESAASAVARAARTELSQGVGWMLLGGLLAACIAIFVPNLPKARAALAGAIGGLLGAWAFFDLSELGGDAVGRVAGAVALGGCVGSMLAAAERASRKAWLEVVYGPRESRIVSLGGEPVTVGSAPGSTVFARAAPAQAFRFGFRDGEVVCDDLSSGRSTRLGDGDVRQAGSIVIRVHADATGRAVAGADAAEPQLVVAGRRPLVLRVGTRLVANDIPGLAPGEGGGAVAEVVANPTRPGVIGLRNLSSRTWKFLRTGADAVDVPRGRAAEIQPGRRIDFGSATGAIEMSGRSPGPVSRRYGTLFPGVVMAGVATGLVAAATADFHRRHPARPVIDGGRSLPINILSLAQAGARRPLRLGVLPTKDGYDDVGLILKDLGAGYSYVPMGWDAVTTSDERLADFDVLFLPCPGPPSELPANELEALAAAIRKYVAGGGTIYASCLAWRRIAKIFPEICATEYKDRETRLGMKTKAQEVTAEVVDADMREEFGDRITLAFDLGGWNPPEFIADSATIYLQGSFELECDRTILEADATKAAEAVLAEIKASKRRLNEEIAQLRADAAAGRIDQPALKAQATRLLQQSDAIDARVKAETKQLGAEIKALDAVVERESRRSAPLLAKMPFEDGFIIFTAFHNGKQRSRRELDLLRYLVYTTVTARLEARTKEQLVEAGFTAARHDLVTRSPGSPERRGTYTCSRPGPLRFALGFNGEGVRLRIDLTSPDGKAASHQTSEPVVVEVPEAAAGDWQYTVTAERLPSDNFPFTITIAEK